MAGFLKTYKDRFLRWIRLENTPVVKVYHGYGDEDMLLIYGHVFKRSPLPRQRYRKNFFSNTTSLLRLFMAKPYPHARLRMKWGQQVIEAETDKDGFFKMEWKSVEPLRVGWKEVYVELLDERYPALMGEGKILIPPMHRYGFVSDIDDTFLVSHSANLRKRLHVLFTKNARTRRPFEGVVKHYQLLSESNASEQIPNPFFYVSSSEWNLYEYIKEFCRHNKMPEGIFLLNQLKQWNQLLKTGQGKHSGKFVRIVRLLKEFPSRQFILLGDDTQDDPVIYAALVEAFPQRIVCVYLRHVRKSRRPIVEHIIERIHKSNVEVCYFKNSSEAIEHSKKMGLITG